MGTATTFDTLQYAKKLKEAGVPEKQAEVQAEALREIEASQLTQLATKEDVSLMRKDFDILREELRGEIKLLKWMMGFVLAGIIAVFVAVMSIIFKA